jgi:hypothetical protein
MERINTLIKPRLVERIAAEDNIKEQGHYSNIFQASSPVLPSANGWGVDEDVRACVCL